jgi:hypothetical protein
LFFLSKLTVVVQVNPVANVSCSWQVEGDVLVTYTIPDVADILGSEAVHEPEATAIVMSFGAHASRNVAGADSGQPPEQSVCVDVMHPSCRTKRPDATITAGRPARMHRRIAAARIP